LKSAAGLWGVDLDFVTIIGLDGRVDEFVWTLLPGTNLVQIVVDSCNTAVIELIRVSVDPFFILIRNIEFLIHD